MTIAAYAATGLLAAGIHAFVLRRRPDHPTHRAALRVALMVGVPAALVMPLSGDISARHIAEYQPAKLAAAEGHFRTERGAPLNILGWPDEETMETRWAIRIPKGLSLLAFHDPDAEVKGLDAFPRDEWPAVAVTHLAFQVMVGLGTAMALMSLWTLWKWWRKRPFETDRRYLAALIGVAPMGLVAVQAGWVVTEVGRQPWIIRGVMRTSEAVTPMPGLVVPFLMFTLLYLFLGVVVVWLLYRLVAKSARPDRFANGEAA
jgi:cytochrome d ubiquinol oxidase subunit I